MEKMRTSLVDAYVRLGCAQGDYLIQQSKLTATTTTESPTSSPTSTSAPDFISAADLDNTFTEVQKFIDASDAKVKSLSSRRLSKGDRILVLMRVLEQHRSHRSVVTYTHMDVHTAAGYYIPPHLLAVGG